MLGKLAVSLLAFLLVLQVATPSVAFTNEYEVSTEDEVVYEVETVLEEADEAPETLDVATCDENDSSFDDWTQEEIEQWFIIEAAHFQQLDHIFNLLFFAEGEFEAFSYILMNLVDEFWILVDEFSILSDEARNSNLSFAEASVELEANTEALANLALAEEIEALGVIVLPPYDAWTDAQIEEWHKLLDLSGDVIDRILEPPSPDSWCDEDFDWERWDERWNERWGELVEALGESLVDLLNEPWQIENDAVRSRLVFEEAVALLDANTVALEYIFEIIPDILSGGTTGGGNN